MNDAGRVLYKYILPLTLLQGFERVVQGLHVRGSWRSNINCNILTPLLWPSRCVFLVLLMLNRRPRAHSSGPKVPFGLMWLSLPHFVYNSVRSSTQLPLPLPTALARRSQLNYIIIRRPLDLWNRMFNRHQVEITVMQFRGHSLLVHYSVMYHGNYLVPFHQPTSAHAISSPNCHWNVCITLE